MNYGPSGVECSIFGFGVGSIAGVSYFLARTGMKSPKERWERRFRIFCNILSETFQPQPKGRNPVSQPPSEQKKRQNIYCWKSQMKFGAFRAENSRFYGKTVDFC